MVIITEKIKNFINFQKLGYVATISADNTPNLSPKGTIIVLDESYLAFADIHSPQTSIIRQSKLMLSTHFLEEDIVLRELQK